MKLPNPPRIDIERVLSTAESRSDLVTYSSEIFDTAYVTDPSSVLIMTGGKGYVRFHEWDLDMLIEELKWIRSEMTRRSRL